MFSIVEIFISIGKAHVIVILIIIVFYIIESSTSFKLFLDNYRWKKSIRNAEDSSNRDSGLYLFILVIIFIYDIINDNIDLNFISFIIWVVMIAVLVKMFYRIHKKYQAVDPNKSDDDFS